MACEKTAQMLVSAVYEYDGREGMNLDVKNRL